MSDKGINIKDRNYVLCSGSRSAAKTEEYYFRALYNIIPHKHPLIVSSKDIYEYVTKLLRQKRDAINYIKRFYSIEAFYEYVEEDGYDETDIEEDFQEELLEILEGKKNDN